MNRPLRSAEIKARIKELEAQTFVMEEELREKFKATYESFKPSNLIKSTFNELTSDPGLKGKILNAAVKLGLGYVGGRLFWNPTGGLAKKAVGAALQLGTSKEIGRNLAVWKRFVSNLFTKNHKAA